MKKLVVIVVAVAVTVLATPATSSELSGKIDAYVTPLAESGHLSGTFFVARGDEVLYERAWGYADGFGRSDLPQDRAAAGLGFTRCLRRQSRVVPAPTHGAGDLAPCCSRRSRVAGAAQKGDVLCRGF